MNQKVNARNMTRSKSGEMFHWIVIIGLPLAFITFFLAGGVKVQVESKGTWQFDFLYNNYLAAEKELLKTSIIGKQAGIETAQELAALGGNLPGIIPSCGELNGVTFWNKADTFCFPDIKKNVESLGKAKLNVATGKIFSKVGYENTVFYGIGGKETITTKYAHYTYDNSFSVDIGYSFDEYGQLFQEATTLVNQCRGKDIECIKSNKLSHWHFESCAAEIVPTSGTEFSFCVDSPSNTEIDGNKLEYKLALDFE